MTAINPQNKADDDEIKKAHIMLAQIEDTKLLQYLLTCIQILAGWQLRRRTARSSGANR